MSVDVVSEDVCCKSKVHNLSYLDQWLCDILQLRLRSAHSVHIGEAHFNQGRRNGDAQVTWKMTIRMYQASLILAVT